MLAYYGTRLSPHMDRTPEGYLVCRDVPIARTGPQRYLARELQLEGDPDRVITVNRHPEDVFDNAVLASFEGKDITQGHPPENVSPENHSSYTKGHVQNVRHSGDYIVADLIIKDANLVSDVWNGTLREVSCGYMCEYVPDGDSFKQTNIRGNHVAVVPRGRAGHEVAIKDAAGKAGKGKKRMKKEATDALRRFFGLAAQDSEPEELEKLTSDFLTVVDGKKEEASGAEAPVKDEAVQEALDAINQRLDAIDQRLEAKGKETDLKDESSIDEAIEKLGGGEKKDGEKAETTIPAEEKSEAKDAAIAWLKAMRPAVAAIKDVQERSRVVDALLSTVTGPDQVAQMTQAVQANAKQAADAAQASTFEAHCRESEAAYAARNPHKKED